MRTVDDVPTEIVQPADVARKSHFEPTAKLTDPFGLPVACAGCYGTPIDHDNVAFAAVKDRSSASPNVGGETRTMKRVAQGKRPQSRTNCTIILNFPLGGKNRKL